MSITVEHLPKGVSLVTLSIETSRNGLNLESTKLLSDTIDSLLEDSTTKSIVITGSGKFFCSGGDIDAFASAIDDGSISDLVGGLTSILHPMELKIRASEKVFVAAINGSAAGGGRGESCGKRVLVIGVPTSLLFDADEDVEAAVVADEATCDAFDFG